MRRGQGEARTILLLNVISARPSKQPLLWYVPSSRYIWSSGPIFCESWGGVWGVWAGPELVQMRCGAFAAALLGGGRLLAAGHQSSSADDDDVFYLFLQKHKKKEGLALMI